MAEAIVSGILEQLALIMGEEIQQDVRLVVGVDKEVKKLTNNLLAVQAVLVDAEKRQVKETTVRVWLDQLKHTSYDMEDVLDEWNTAFMKFQMEGSQENAIAYEKKVCFFFPFPCLGIEQVVLRRDIALKIEEINGNLDVIAKEKDMYNFNVIRSIEKQGRIQSTSLVDVSEICGRVDEKNTLVSKLLCDTCEGLHIISIVGMGGIGKTTLAQFAYNDNKVISNFEKRIWVCVSDPFDEFKIAKAIVEAMVCPAPNLVELEALIQCICESIMGKKFLLVLDDMWTEDYDKWEPFYHCLKSGLHGSKILITTRKDTVASMMESIEIINIKELSEEACWSLFRRLAFFGKSRDECEKLEQIGKDIVGKCKGLPLAIKTIGSLLRFKKTREGWQSILDSEMWKVEEFEKGIFPPLLLSYNNLPSMVKRCFSYCAIFPKDYKIKKDHLIKLWMAQGYLGIEQNKDIEIIGENYFDILAAHSFFEEFEKDCDGNVMRCKMHDMIHDFAQFLTINECFMVEVNAQEEQFINSSHLEKLRHSLLILGKETSFPISICCLKRLRSLLIGASDDGSSVNDVLPKLFGKLTCLRALDLNIWDTYNLMIKEIPKEIRKLIHLRYLNLSGSGIEKLPETLCELYNLQTLDLTWCCLLKELPQGMGKLINLRHLLNYGNYSLRYMPMGIERLTCLQTLKEFILSGGGYGDKACSLECLKKLNHLFGEFRIRGLGNVLDVGEAKRIELKNKKNILNLYLNFDKLEEGGRTNEDDELLLEALEPPPNLEKLKIKNYRGNIVSSYWMMSLTKLRELRLSYCINCKHLSLLRKLSSLESLWIDNMQSVKRVDNKFWGIENDGTTSSAIVFSRLKSLTFSSMYEWEEWDYGKGDGKDIIIMPCLCDLRIVACPKLKELPDYLLQRTTLKKLYISICTVLEERYEMEIGEDWHKISQIPIIKINFDYVKRGPS